jgi:hypothetical protein
MRGLRSFGALLVVLAALAAYLFFVEAKRPAGGDTPARDKVFAVDADKIEEISIKAEAGDRTVVRKSGDGWQIVQPAPAPPDPAEISGLTTNLASLEIQSVVDENPPDLKEYGLAAPRVEVSFKAAGQDRTLHIGSKTPPGTDLYARLADQKKVFLISSYLDTTFNKRPFDLRDKTVLAVERDKIDGVEIVAAGRTVKLAKPAGEWRLAAPIQGRADFNAVEGLLGRLVGLQMKSVVAPDASDLKPYGLDKAAATVRIGAGSSQATLVIGTSAGEGVVYAKDLSRPIVMTIDAALLDDLKKDPSELRQKDLFDARAFNATRLELTREGQTFTFEKTKVKNKEGQEEQKWRRISPAAGDVDQSKVDALISAITSLRAASFADAAAKTGLDKPEMSIAIKFDEGRQEERVTIGRVGADAYAARAGELGAAKIDASALDNTIKALGELK